MRIARSRNRHKIGDSIWNARPIRRDALTMNRVRGIRIAS